MFILSIMFRGWMQRNRFLLSLFLFFFFSFSHDFDNIIFAHFWRAANVEWKYLILEIVTRFIILDAILFSFSPYFFFLIFHKNVQGISLCSRVLFFFFVHLHFHGFIFQVQNNGAGRLLSNNFSISINWILYLFFFFQFNALVIPQPLKLIAADFWFFVVNFIQFFRFFFVCFYFISFHDNNG